MLETIQKEDIEIKIDLKKRQALNYNLGVHIYQNYIKHFVENKLDKQKVRILFYCEGSGKIPFGFITGIIDGMNVDKIDLEEMEFKVNSIAEDITLHTYKPRKGEM